MAEASVHWSRHLMLGPCLGCSASAWRLAEELVAEAERYESLAARKSYPPHRRVTLEMASKILYMAADEVMRAGAASRATLELMDRVLAELKARMLPYSRYAALHRRLRRLAEEAGARGIRQYGVPAVDYLD